LSIAGHGELDQLKQATSALSPETTTGAGVQPDPVVTPVAVLATYMLDEIVTLPVAPLPTVVPFTVVPLTVVIALPVVV
jgi:hypothetical protein